MMVLSLERFKYGYEHIFNVSTVYGSGGVWSCCSVIRGTSAEREVSLLSGRNVLEVLRMRGVDAQSVDGVPALAQALVERRFDRVFNVLHGHNGGGEDGVVQGLMQAFGVPYTGSDVLASALSMDKVRTKQVWLALGLPTPRYASLSVCATAVEVRKAVEMLGFPVIIKPAKEGSSVGVSRVFALEHLEEAVALAARYEGELLMEQLIEGDELTVSILDEMALPSIRIVPQGQWYDYNAKYLAEDTQYVCPVWMMLLRLKSLNLRWLHSMVLVVVVGVVWM